MLTEAYELQETATAKLDLFLKALNRIFFSSSGMKIVLFSIT